jgi:hypothetical protein
MNIHRPGTLIAGRFEVAGRPQMGGMGIVYLRFGRQEKRPVALKTFWSKFLPSQTAWDRFPRKGVAWVNPRCHPHIVRYYDVKYIGD